MGSRNDSSTAPRVRLAQIMPRAIQENWTVQELATNAKVSYKTAHSEMVKVRDQIILSSRSTLQSKTSILVAEAQKSRDFALSTLARLRRMTQSAAEHVEAMSPTPGKDGRPVALDEFGQAIPFDAGNYAKAVAVVTKANKELLTYAEQITGVDVAKQIAIKAATAKDGLMHSWDGVDSLTDCIEAEIVQDVERIQHVPILPPPKKSVQLW